MGKRHLSVYGTPACNADFWANDYQPPLAEDYREVNCRRCWRTGSYKQLQLEARSAEAKEEA